GKPKRQTIDEHGRRSVGGKRAGEIARRLEGCPTGPTPGPMPGNALRHLRIARFGCCQIDPGRWRGGYQALGVAALARASATENEREPDAARCSGGRQDDYAPGTS